jgi:hypothetical protein
MLFRTKLKTTSNPRETSQSLPEQPVSPERQIASRELYERIARGHGLADAEDQAQRDWRES